MFHKVLCLARGFLLSLLTTRSRVLLHLLNCLPTINLVYRTIHSSNDAIQLQEGLDQLGLLENSRQMTLNPHQCSTMHFSNKRSTVCAKYAINGFPLYCGSGVKYRGVSISSKMSWSVHIDDICTKARKSLRFIRRNLRNYPQYVRIQAYTSLVRTCTEYACFVWDPYQRKHIKQLESVQHHAARSTTGNYDSMKQGCVTNMVTQLGWNLLEHRRANHRITMLYQIFNNLANIPVHHQHHHHHHQHHHHQLKVHDSSTRGSASRKSTQLSTKLNCYKHCCCCCC